MAGRTFFSCTLFRIPPPAYEELEVLVICMDLEIQRKNKYCICVNDSSFQFIHIMKVGLISR